MNLLSFPTESKPDAERYESLLTYLEELLSVKDEQSAEIVKFLQAILDKLIDIILDLKTKHSKDASNISEKTYEIHSKKIQHGVFEILIGNILKKKCQLFLYILKGILFNKNKLYFLKPSFK